MITFTVEAILGVLLVIVLMNLFKKHPTPPVPTGPVEDLANLKPTDARVGDSLSISGAGDDMTDLDFTIDRSTWFQAGARQWFELGGPYRNRRVSMRVANNEEVEVSVHTDPRKVTLEDLGLSEEDMGQLDERQNTADNFEFDGKVWLYILSREAQSKRTDQPEPQAFYYWEFREQGGPGVLSVRKAEGEPFTLTLFAGISAGDVTVYRGGRA
ncbi:conserved hypothetical protein [Candidatus Sulfopaludibacter sp. SbA3]|nr:conserved hypothetical protein [Candidatus Sulfopaludibacter sp. SbA3]